MTPTPAPSPLRVLMVSPTGVFGGAERVLVGLAEHAGRHDIDVATIVLGPGPLASKLRDVGGQVVEIDRGRLRDPRAWWRTTTAIAAVGRSFNADVIVGNMAMGQLYTFRAARRLGIPGAWIQMDEPRGLRSLGGVASVLPANLVLCCSTSVARRQRHMRRTPAVSVLHLGTDVQRFAPSPKATARQLVGLSLDGPVVGMVGRLQEWKRQDVFLRAAAKVVTRHPAARFVLVGGPVLGWEGDYPERLRHLADELGIADNVVFAGNQSDVAPWYCAFDITVNCSELEPFGMVITESMACERPIVAVASGGPAEVIENGRTGVLVARSDPELIAAALTDLLDSPERCSEMGRAARRSVIDHFSVDTMIATLAAQLNGLVKPRVGMRSRAGVSRVR
jgi:glycosyltransferase involved in cell wall biosynthesis